MVHLRQRLGMHYVGWGPAASSLPPLTSWSIAARSPRRPAPSSSTARTSLLKGADALYTDIWASMGEEDKIPEAREAAPLQGHRRRDEGHRTSDCIFLHCLPSFHDFDTTMAKSQMELGYDIREVTDEVFLSPNSKGVRRGREPYAHHQRLSWSPPSATSDRNNSLKGDDLSSLTAKPPVQTGGFAALSEYKETALPTAERFRSILRHGDGAHGRAVSVLKRRGRRVGKVFPTRRRDCRDSPCSQSLCRAGSCAQDSPPCPSGRWRWRRCRRP